jgi:hypothetical protein
MIRFAMGSSEDRAYPALCVWIDRQMQKRTADQRWGIFGAVCGTTAGILGAISGNATRIFGFVFDLPIVMSLWLAYLLGLAIYAHEIMHRNRADARQDEARYGPYWNTTRQNLLIARVRGQLVARFGVDGAQLLDRASASALRVEAAFDSEAWRSSQDSVFAVAKTNARQNLDAAMARLILLIDQHGVTPAAVEIAHDIEALAAEVEATAHSGSLDPSAECGLRETLNEMRAIRAATEEARASLRQGD